MKKILLLFASMILLSSCVKTIEPTPYSILGDSYSSFEGYVDPDTNDPWPHYAEIGVTGVEQMWWWQVADSTGWVMDHNNSFSGSLISNFADFEDGNYYAPNSFLRRMDNLGNPDVIFVFGGTNDVWQDAPFGGRARGRRAAGYAGYLPRVRAGAGRGHGLQTDLASSGGFAVSQYT